MDCAVDLARHAVAAAQVAAVGDGDAQVAQGPVELVEHPPGSRRCASATKLRAVTRDEWIAAFAREAGVERPSPQEVRELLELAGTAAHASERTAAPLACWIAGRSGMSLQALRAIAERVDAPPG